MLGRYMIEQLNELRLKNVQCDLELVSSDNRTFNMHQIVFTALNQKHFHLAVQQACIYSSDIILSKKKMYLSQLSSSELEMLIEFMYGATFTTKTTYDILLSALGKLDMLYLLDMIGGFTLDNDSTIKTETSTNTNISNETIDPATQDTSIQPRNELGTNTEPVDNIFTNIHVESNDLTSDVGSIKEEPVSPVSTPVIITVSKPSTAPPCNPETDEPRHEELSIRKDLFNVDAVNDSMLQELKTEIETDNEIVGVDVDEIERVYQNFKQSVMSEKLNGTKYSFTDQNPTDETPAVPGVTVTNTVIENDFNENVVLDVQLDPTTKSSTIRCINTVQYPPKDQCVKDSCQKQLDVHNNDNNDAALLNKTSTVPPHCTSPTAKSPTVKSSTVKSPTVKSSTVKSPTVKSSVQSTAVPHTYILPKRSVLLINTCAPSLSAGDTCTTSNTLSSQASSSITQQKLPTVVKVTTTGKSNKNVRSSMGKHDKAFLPNNGVVDQSQVSRNKATPIACSIFSLSKVSYAPSNCASTCTTTGTTSVSVTNQQIFAPKIYAVNSQSSSQVLQQSISLRRSDKATTSEDIKTMVSGRQNFQNTDSMTTEHMIDTKIGDPKPKIQQKSKLMKRKITSKQVKDAKQAHESHLSDTQRNLTMTENKCDNDTNKFKVIVNDPVYGDPSSVVTLAGSETEAGSEYDNDILQTDTEQSSSDVPNQPEFTINENQCANDMSDGATSDSAQSSFEFSHRTFQTEAGNTIIQAEISNETTRLETGKKTNQSEIGIENISSKTGNETNQSETGNETNQSETGNETNQSETGKEFISSKTGNETSHSETDNEVYQSETGNETSHSETDNEVYQSETGNDTILTETGNETNQSETGNEAIQSETETILLESGNETILSETSNEIILSETGYKTSSPNTGNETKQSETGNETSHSETDNEVIQSETSNDTILTETGNKTNLSETGDETIQSETGNETILSKTGNVTIQSETSDETIQSETDKGFVLEQFLLADPNGTIEPIVTTSIITQCTSSICTSSITSSSTSLSTGQYMTLRSKQSPKVHENSLISDKRVTHSSKLDTSMCKVVLHDCYKQSIVSAKETPVCNNSYFGKKDKIKKQLRKPLFKKSSKQNDRSKAVSDEHNAKCKNTVYSQMKGIDFIKIDGTLPTNLAECDVLTENATAFLKEPIQNVATSSKSLVYSQSNKQVINFGDVGSVDNVVKEKPIERVNPCENAEKSKVVASFRKSIYMPSTEYGNFSMLGFTDQSVENEFIVLDEVSNLPVTYTSLNNNLSIEKTPSKSSSDSCIVPLSEILSLTPAQLVKNYQTIVKKSKQKNETIKLPRSGEKGASKSPAFKTFDRTFRRTKSKSDIFEKSSDCQLFKNDQTMIEKSRKRKSISPIEDIENDLIVSAGNIESVKADGQKNPKRGNSEPGTDRQLVKKYKTLAEILGKTTTNVNHVECTAGYQNRDVEKSSSVSTVITQAVYSGSSKYVNVTLNSACTVSSAISRMPPVNVSPEQNLTGRQAPSPVVQSKVLFPKVPATVIRFPVRILGHTFQSAKPVVQQEQSTITFSSTSPICSYTTVSKSSAEQINHSRKRWKSTPAFPTKEGKKRKLLNCNEKGDFHSLVVDSNPDKSVALENCTGTAEQNVHVDYNQDVQEIIVDIVENSEEVDIKRNVDPPSSHLRVALFAETESNHDEHGIKQTHRNVRQLNEMNNSNVVEPDEGDSVLVISTDDHMTGHVSDESVVDKPVRNKVNKTQFAENTLDTNLTGGNKDGISSKVSFKAPSLKSRRTYLSELRKQDALQRARRSQLARKKGTGNSKQPTKKVPSFKAKYHANDLDFTSKLSDNVPTVIIAPCATNEHTLDSCLTAYKIEKLKCAISTSLCIKPSEVVSPVLESPCLLSEQRSAITSTSSVYSVSTYSTSTSCVNYPTSSIPATLSTMFPCSSYTSPIFTQLLTRSQSVGSSSDTIELMSTSEGKSSTVTLQSMSSQSAVALIKSPTPVLSSLLACSAATPMSDTVKSAKPKLVGKNKKKNPAEKSKDGVKKKRVRVSKKRKVELTPTLPAVNVLRPIISTSNSILPAFNGLGVINAIRSPLPVSLNSSNSPYRQILPKPPFVSLVIRQKIDKVN